MSDWIDPDMYCDNCGESLEYSFRTHETPHGCICDECFEALYPLVYFEEDEDDD